jgi:ergothioneine biosynthesis protein EgtB
MSAPSAVPTHVSEGDVVRRVPLQTERLEALAQRFARVRSLSEQIASPLSAEDCAIQSMPDVSPTRWHLAHTTWFFETFVLAQSAGYEQFNADFQYLFNSYYNAVGEQFPRARRGLISRPGLAEVMAYRTHVDRQMVELLHKGIDADTAAVIELGLNHEQQHQELMLTDIKHVLSCNPLDPIYQSADRRTGTALPLQWRQYAEGVYWIGHEGNGFAYDNESPRHRQFLERFELASRLVTCGEFLDFMDDGGYRRPELWLSLGWQWMQEQRISSPLYWEKRDGDWTMFTLAGRMPLEVDEPVCHVSYFEADAFARWAGVRLPTEAEWEVAAADVPLEAAAPDDLFDRGWAIHPASPDQESPALAQMFGEIWQWTASPYTAYPGYRPPEGALGEYNGKFMCNQYVLRGGSCATPAGHIRPTYRNFFPPEARWQFTGIRLAR